MKFKDLPEGYYYVHSVGNTVPVQMLTEEETTYTSLTETYATTKVVHDGREYTKNGRILNDLEVEYKTFEEMRKDRKIRGARYSHVTRRINAEQPLKGETLELALELVECEDPSAGVNSEPFSQEVARKLKAGEPLTEYEKHIMVDMRIVHARLA